MEQKALYREFTQTDGSAVYLKAVFGLLAVNLLFGLVAMGVTAAGGADPTKNGLFNYAVMALMQAVNAGVVVWHCRKNRTRPDYSIRNPVKLPTIGIAVLAGAVSLFGFYGMAFAFEAFLNVVGYVGQVNIPFTSPAEIAVGVIMTVAVAPVCEELVYRGALLSGLRRGFPWWAAVLLSGLAFSLMHMNPQQTVYQFFLGCVCALLALSSGSVIPAVVIHAASNLLAVLVELTPFGGAFEAFIAAISPNAGIAFLWIAGSALAAAAALFGLVVLGRRLRIPVSAREYAEADPLTKSGGMLGKKTGKVFYCIGLGVCLFLWIIVFAQGVAHA